MRKDPWFDSLWVGVLPIVLVGGVALAVDTSRAYAAMGIFLIVWLVLWPIRLAWQYRRWEKSIDKPWNGPLF